MINVLNYENVRESSPDLICLGKKILFENETRSHHDFVIAKCSYWTIGCIITRKEEEELLYSNLLTKLLPINEYLPIMHDSHPNAEWKSHFSNRNPFAISLDSVLITPAHCIGDEGYISDTEHSMKLSSSNESHPKYYEQNSHTKSRDEL